MKRLASLLCLLSLLLVAAVAQAATDATGGKGVLIVAFGTSMESALPSFKAIEADYAKAYPGQPIVWAYTSDIIRKKLAGEGKTILSVNQALDECARKGIRDLRVQTLHVTGGEEYIMLQRMIVRNLTKNPGRFDHLWLGHPLLESSRDLEEVMAAVLDGLKKDRKAGDAVVLMGHGNDRGPGDLPMARVRAAFHEKDALVFVATVEGANSFDSVLPQLKAKGVKRVHIAPFMVVAGDHANNDLAGDEDDSWASMIRKAGMEVVPHLHGLGENAGVRKVYLRHTKDTRDDMANPRKSD